MKTHSNFIARIFGILAIAGVGWLQPTAAYGQTAEGTDIVNTATVSFSDANTNTCSTVDGVATVTVGHAAGIDVVAATDIRVEVADGLIINGVPVVGEVRVELTDTALTVTRPLDLDIRDGDSVFLLMDLNANTWLQAVDPVLKVIAEEVFGDAVSVGVR